MRKLYLRNEGRNGGSEFSEGRGLTAEDAAILDAHPAHSRLARADERDANLMRDAAKCRARLPNISTRGLAVYGLTTDEWHDVL